MKNMKCNKLGQFPFFDRLHWQNTFIDVKTKYRIVFSCPLKQHVVLQHNVGYCWAVNMDSSALSKLECALFPSAVSTSGRCNDEQDALRGNTLDTTTGLNFKTRLSPFSGWDEFMFIHMNSVLFWDTFVCFRQLDVEACCDR
jgi:hypothetical protein